MAKRQRDTKPEEARYRQDNYTIQRRNRCWEVRDPAGDLVCLTVYKCGAQEVVRRISIAGTGGLEPSHAR
jgi:hypothetical protein